MSLSTPSLWLRSRRAGCARAETARPAGRGPEYRLKVAVKNEDAGGRMRAALVRAHPASLARAHHVPAQIVHPLDGQVPLSDDAVYIQIPDAEGTGCVVLPEQIGHAISADIPNTMDLPIQIGGEGGERSLIGDGGTVHQPHAETAIRLVLPHGVGSAITVDVAGSGDQPVSLQHPRDTQGQRCGRLIAVHQPDRQPSAVVLPDDIRLAIAIDVGNPT